MPQRYFKTRTKNSIPVETVDVLVDKPSRFIQQVHEKPSLPPTRRRLLPWMIVLGVILLILSVLFLLLQSYTSRFNQAAHTTWQALLTEFNSGRKINPFTNTSHYSYLVLGIDEISNQREGSQLTDTMMVVTIENTGRITLISLPRDLWIDSLKTKINALYYYGEENEKNSGTQLVSSVVGEITGLNIQGYFVVNMESVKTVIDAIGGIQIDIPKAFTDAAFPRADINIATTTDPTLLYETVSFSAGTQRLDGTMALKYMRSRHSEDQSEGNDLARVRRQQQVVQALIRQVTSPHAITNPTLLGNMYHVWKTTVNTDMTDENMFSLGWYLAHKPLTLITTQIPIQQGNQVGILVHPPVEKYNLWVYEPVDSSWLALRTWIAEQLLL